MTAPKPGASGLPQAPRKASEPGLPPVDRVQFLRTEFLDRVAHELRGPAGVTLGALDELELALGDKAEEHRAVLAMARRGVRKVLRTAERLTRSAQLESGSVSFMPTPTDLKKLLEHAARDAEQLEARRGVTLELSGPEHACVARLDAAWVQLALTELIAHGLRGAKKLVTITLAVDGTTVRVAVRDDSATTATPSARRFEPRSDRRDAGLSLPLVEEIARAHGGDLTLDTATPSGTLAVLTFEVAQ